MYETPHKLSEIRRRWLQHFFHLPASLCMSSTVFLSSPVRYPALFLYCIALVFPRPRIHIFQAGTSRRAQIMATTTMTTTLSTSVACSPAGPGRLSHCWLLMRCNHTIRWALCCSSGPFIDSIHLGPHWVTTDDGSARENQKRKRKILFSAVFQRRGLCSDCVTWDSI